MSELVQMKAEHARLWYELYNLLTKTGGDMSVMKRYPCVYNWNGVIVEVHKQERMNNQAAVLWYVERSRDVNTAIKAMIDQIYSQVTE